MGHQSRLKVGRKLVQVALGKGPEGCLRYLRNLPKKSRLDFLLACRHDSVRMITITAKEPFMNTTSSPSNEGTIRLGPEVAT